MDRKSLQAINNQSFKDFKVVLVDNGSSDNTVNIFKQVMPNGRILEINEFFPGKAINTGIEVCHCELVVVLSAHCIPVHTHWLSSLVEIMHNEKLGAAYGRQVPLDSSHPLDKRDLLNTFGLERRIQKKDTFFHNANSIIRRSVWEKHQFDENIKHIEDRVWAEKIIDDKFAIGYEPGAEFIPWYLSSRGPR